MSYVICFYALYTLFPCNVKDLKSKIHGVTLIELLIVMSIMAVLMTALVPYMRSGRQVWEVVGDRHADVLQNARIGMDKMTREIRQAQSISDAGSSYIEFADRDENDRKFQHNAGYLEYGTPGDLNPLAGPVDSFSLTYYKEDGITETTTPGEVRSVLIQLSTSDSEGKVAPITLSSRVFTRKDAMITPTVTTNDATKIGKKNARLNMDYDFNDYSSGYVEFGYKEAIGGSWTYTGWKARSGSGSYFEQISGLTPGATYDFKAQLKYGGTVIEGAEKSFTTLF